MKYPEKLEICSSLLQKDVLSTLDVLRLNQMIFGIKRSGSNRVNQRHKSYDITTIMEILEYQRKKGYTNVGIANEFQISRNSLAKWKKLFL